MKLDTPAARLRWARERHRKFDSPTDAARERGWTVSTYLGHENGDRNPSRDAAKRYAKAYGVRWEWLLEGDGNPDLPKGEKGSVGPPMAPLVGFVGAGAEAHFLPAGDLDEVPAPEGSTKDTVAVEIRGDSLGSFFDRWLVFYDDVRRPVTPDLINRLCVVGLEDGRVLIKKLQRSKARGLFHLVSQTESPILDVAVEWAARVKHMTPR